MYFGIEARPEFVRAQDYRAGGWRLSDLILVLKSIVNPACDFFTYQYLTSFSCRACSTPFLFARRAPAVFTTSTTIDNRPWLLYP